MLIEIDPRQRIEGIKVSMKDFTDANAPAALLRRVLAQSGEVIPCCNIVGSIPECGLPGMFGFIADTGYRIRKAEV